MDTQDEQTLGADFRWAEEVVEKELQDKLGQSNSKERSEKLEESAVRLQRVAERVDGLALFSLNEELDDVPTASLHYLLVPAYQAYVLDSVYALAVKRADNLKQAKILYTRFLDSLYWLKLVPSQPPALSMHWLRDVEAKRKAMSAPNDTRQPNFEEMARTRQLKLQRHTDLKEAECALQIASVEYQRLKDEESQRRFLLALIRVWGTRAILELDKINAELDIMAYMLDGKPGEDPVTTGSAKPPPPRPMRMITIPKREKQKKVFGLGYPSAPTQTVNEWFDERSSAGAFAAPTGRAPPAQPSSSRSSIRGGAPHEDHGNLRIEEGRAGEAVDGASSESDSEESLQKKRNWDDWKDTHRRGYGNTHGKG